MASLAACGCVAAMVLLVACSSSARPTRVFVVPSAAMDPTIRENATIRVYMGNYRPHRGDVITFRAPANGATPGIALPSGGTLPILQPSKLVVVKRVVGLPGETIEARDGHVYIDDHLLPEPYLPADTRTNDLPRQTVPAGSWYVMGDNRVASADSRVFGAIPQTSVLGRVCTCDLRKL